KKINQADGTSCALQTKESASTSARVPGQVKILSFRTYPPLADVVRANLTGEISGYDETDKLEDTDSNDEDNPFNDVDDEDVDPSQAVLNNSLSKMVFNKIVCSNCRDKFFSSASYRSTSCWHSFWLMPNPVIFIILFALFILLIKLTYVISKRICYSDLNRIQINWYSLNFIF
ncbi:hypothetical protein HZS_1912, partial [Henneguya salminicola]